MISATPIRALRVSAYAFPTTTEGEALPESDGTASWDSTGVLLVELDAGEATGLGYAYCAAPAALEVVRGLLAPVVRGADALAPAALADAMVRSVRNAGRAGVCASAISAIDVAAHDLAARILDVPLGMLLGAAGERVMAYGSGGFTSYDDATLQRQFAGWAEEGLRAVKMKIGTDPAADPRRVAAARSAIGPGVELFVDANGVSTPQRALGVARMLAEHEVSWYEEPVSSDDLPGLRFVREHVPAGMDVAAGEYGYAPEYFHRMLGAVDVLQADGTRCGGVSGFRSAALQAQAAGTRLSAHTAPALHATLGAALPDVVHVEYFHDHVLIEQAMFDGLPALVHGDLVPSAAPGLGLELRRADVADRLTGQWAS